MTTADARVFAAGDGAFGGSTIVEAMYQGHRAAYYMKAMLEGNEAPLPYRTPYRTRRVPICNDPDWEINARVHQQFHGLGQVPIEFPEIESTYTAAEAKAEAARCFRCDAETGSADYTVGSRESIFAMARINPSDIDKQTSILEKRLENRDNPFTGEHVATLDDLVFLPANLSRLVIDPYREGCVTATKFGAIQSLKLDIPFTVTGLDDAPTEIRESVAKSIVAHGAAYIGSVPLGGDAKWVQVVGSDVDPSADAIVVSAEQAIAAGGVVRANPQQPAGLLAGSANVEAAVDFALAQSLDFILLDPTSALPGLAGELAGAPDISIVHRAVVRLRELDREEEVDLVYFGGLRTGTPIYPAASRFSMQTWTLRNATNAVPTCCRLSPRKPR
jgi:hypothetical protein